jgi:ElaB/YqjD/DUF883 family membrane-anchored ribosome-binding protein
MGEEPGPMTPDPASSRADSASGADDPAAIRADIEQTRVEMSETVDAIQEKLSPQHIVEQAKETVRDATVGRIKDMASSVGETVGDVATQVQEGAQQAAEYVRDNPWPALLIGAGVTWMLLQTQRSPRRMPSVRSDPRMRRPEAWRESPGTGARQRAVGEKTETMQERWQQYSTRAETEFQRWMRENPLTVGAAAVALGAAVGLTAPRTQTEDEWMGETRDALMERAQEVAEDTVQQAQKVVDGAGRTVEQARQAVSGSSQSVGGASRV